eukprot:326559-Pyramimonas_sp.AAC.1
MPAANWLIWRARPDPLRADAAPRHIVDHVGHSSNLEEGATTKQQVVQHRASHRARARGACSHRPCCADLPADGATHRGAPGAGVGGAEGLREARAGAVCLRRLEELLVVDPLVELAGVEALRGCQPE